MIVRHSQLESVMNRKNSPNFQRFAVPFLMLLGVLGMQSGASVPAAETPSLAGTRPNIILVLTDDQGMGDLSCFGNPVLRTPNMDSLRTQSTQFTDFQVSPTCAPTRSAIMSGRHEFKN